MPIQHDHEALLCALMDLPVFGLPPGRLGELVVAVLMAGEGLTVEEELSIVREAERLLFEGGPLQGTGSEDINE